MSPSGGQRLLVCSSLERKRERGLFMLLVIGQKVTRFIHLLVHNRWQLIFSVFTADSNFAVAVVVVAAKNTQSILVTSANRTGNWIQTGLTQEASRDIQMYFCSRQNGARVRERVGQAKEGLKANYLSLKSDSLVRIFVRH